MLFLESKLFQKTAGRIMCFSSSRKKLLSQTFPLNLSSGRINQRKSPFCFSSFPRASWIPQLKSVSQSGVKLAFLLSWEGAHFPNFRSRIQEAHTYCMCWNQTKNLKRMFIIIKWLKEKMKLPIDLLAQSTMGTRYLGRKNFLCHYGFMLKLPFFIPLTLCYKRSL